MRMRMLTTATVALASAATAGAQTMAPAAPAAKPAVAAAPDPAALDARRHGPEILAFAGVKKGDVVIDLAPGATGYWTKLFSAKVGPAGHVYGVWPEPMATSRNGAGLTAYRAIAADPAYANVTVSVEPAVTVTAPAKADLVFTSQNYHDYPDPFMGSVDMAAFDRSVFAALKPGGIFLVVDHAADAGSGLRDTNTLHRIDPAAVKAQVTAAGFRFEGASALLANPADDHTKNVFDASIRGHTDQFIYKFRKPR